MRFLRRTLQRLPICFLRSTSVWPLLERGLAAVYLDHREANSSVMKFFHELFDCSKTNVSKLQSAVWRNACYRSKIVYILCAGSDVQCCENRSGSPDFRKTRRSFSLPFNTRECFQITILYSGERS